MKILDLYTPFWDVFSQGSLDSFEKALQSSKELTQLKKMAVEWEQDISNVERWMKSEEYKSQRDLAHKFLVTAPQVVARVEKIFGRELDGEVRLSPSMMRFDGFARYDRGRHTVWLGVDHPDADENYLRVLLAHELSHVYRDHRPEVWGFLKKPLEKLTRREYLDNMSAQEHLASEGLATLFSQLVYPNISLHVHHYYFPEEMTWCLQNFEKIDVAIRKCLHGDQNVWKFYEPGVIDERSPSRTQYFWAARTIGDWLAKLCPDEEYRNVLVGSHGWAASKFECFEER